MLRSTHRDRGDEELDETSQAGRGFLAEVCTEWEREALAAEALNVRVACVRIGIVLAPGGGALARMLTRFRMGAVVGSAAATSGSLD